MPYSLEIERYPDSLYTILNHACLRGGIEIPCLDRSPYSLRVYFHAYRRALGVAAASDRFDAARRKAYGELARRFSPLVFQVNLGPPPILEILPRDSTDLSRFLASQAQDLAFDAGLRGRGPQPPIEQTLEELRGAEGERAVTPDDEMEDLIAKLRIPEDLG